MSGAEQYKVVGQRSPDMMIVSFAVEPPIPMIDHGLVNLGVTRGLASSVPEDASTALKKVANTHRVSVRNEDGQSHVTVDMVSTFKGIRSEYQIDQANIQRYLGSVVEATIAALNEQPTVASSSQND